MITRALKDIQVVPAFLHNAKFVACGQANLGTCTCAGGLSAAGSTYWFPGFVIDRTGLNRSPKAVAVVPNVIADVQASDNNIGIQHYAFSIGLQHASSSGATFADLSTEQWLENVGLWRGTTATSTGNAMYTARQFDVYGNPAGGAFGSTPPGLGAQMTSTTSTSGGAGLSGSTSTGLAYYVGRPAVFDLSKANRYIRAVVKPIINSTACGSGGMDLSAVFVFGEQDWAPSDFSGPYAESAMGARVIVTTACAT